MHSSELRHSGLQAVGELPWGAHFCQFYDTKDDLVETLVPYFSEGLRRNEACLWITSEPLPAEEARELMVRAVPDFAGALAQGQIEIRDLSSWYRPEQRFDAEDVLGAWLERERLALRGGYDGLRLTGNTFWLERSDWQDFMHYEHKVNGAFASRRIMALCTYCMQRCGAQEVIDVVRNHQFALARRHGRWEMLEAASLKIAKDELHRLNQTLETRVAQRTQELEAALRSRDEFLAMLAHELRNPLAPIRSAAHLVRLLAPGQHDLAEASAVLDRQVSHLSRLIDDLLDGARIAKGVIRLRRETLSVAAAITRALESSQPGLTARRHALAVSLPSEPLHVEADPTRLAQILSNLLDNAAKYTPEGGRIEVRVAREGAEVAIRVRDNGVGIPQEMLERVFEVFTQLEPSPERTEGGLGLGLTLVRKLVEMHGGRVQGVSEGRGRGAEFVVRLPLAAAPQGAGTAAQVRAPEPARRRVLVVDDNPDSVTTMALALKLLGHEVRTAASGPAALAAAEDLRPDVVLLDLGLPGMDGYEVARRLRALPAARAARIVALTGYAAERGRWREAGFDEHQLKPISMDNLEKILAWEPS
ncbi:MAG TPA: MEDS domain-containing protein [Burkholderiales bacterium]|nr:MEDS domain-containing protein [Burkholderiales bacterium]